MIKDSICWLLFVVLVSCKAPSGKNVLFLLTDDQRWDALGAVGNTLIETPEMDRLAAEGVICKNAYVTTPICAVSRSSILSGQYSRVHGIHDFITHFADSAYQNTYPMLLKKAGYKIGFIGKYGIGTARDMPDSLYDFWRCFPGQGQYWHQNPDSSYSHLTAIMGRQIDEFLDTDFHDSLFCLSVSFKAPHVQDSDPRQFLYDSAYQDLYKNTLFPIPQTADSAYWEAFPEFFKNNNEARRRWAMRFSTPDKYQTSVRGYYRLIYGIDVVLGNLREKLASKALDKNTVIMLMGDNGFYLGEHGLAGKWYAHGESIRVPLILYDPTLKKSSKGRAIDQMILNIDIAPTILDYAGLSTPQGMQGKSFRPLAEGKHVAWRNKFLFEHLFIHSRIPRSEGIVKKNVKYVRFLVDDPQRGWLFDLQKNPLETINYADSPSYANVKAKLSFETDSMI